MKSEAARALDLTDAKSLLAVQEIIGGQEEIIGGQCAKIACRGQRTSDSRNIDV